MFEVDNNNLSVTWFVLLTQLSRYLSLGSSLFLIKKYFFLILQPEAQTHHVTSFISVFISDSVYKNFKKGSIGHSSKILLFIALKQHYVSLEIRGNKSFL